MPAVDPCRSRSGLRQVLPLLAAVVASPGAGHAQDADRDDLPITVTAGRDHTTVLTVVIGTEGRVTDCRVKTPSGVPQLDDAACRIAREQWAARPATANGVPVAS